jgi:hypothetical protein
MEMVRKDLLGKYLASSRFFPSRALLPRLTEDVERSKETKVLQFTKTHLGDSDNPLAAQILFECANEFDI